MPIPESKPTENQREFMQRCIEKTIKEYDKDQAIAICYNKWTEK
jgi:hypothetical protein